jgi:hypothetical protein
MKMNDKWWSITARFLAMAAMYIAVERILLLLGKTQQPLNMEIPAARIGCANFTL